MPSDLSFKAMNAFHRVLLSLSRSRVGSTISEMPVLELTTTGRKSGRPHAVMLTSPVQQETNFVVVASRGGDDKPPAWLLNLQADPAVEVAVQGKPKAPMTARVANAEERAEIWPRITACHRNYADYQKKTEREIALVILEPNSR